MLDKNKAFESLKAQIQVTRQQVVLAKAFMMDHFHSDTWTMIKGLLRSLEITMPDKIVLHESADPDGMIRKAAEAISWTLAGCEAIWGLISTSHLIPKDCQLKNLIRFPSWATKPGSSGGRTGSWETEIYFPVPISVALPYSIRKPASASLTDPDLFLQGLSIEGLHPDIEDSLREAVRCFRHELYLACLTMLGRASEGAWIELGLKLAECEASNKAEKLKAKVESPRFGIAKKIGEVAKFYSDRDSFNHIYLESEIKPQDLANVMVWADSVRESRNSVHYGVKPSMPNSYEKVAALLIAAVPHLTVLYKIIAAVDRVRGQSSP